MLSLPANAAHDCPPCRMCVPFCAFLRAAVASTPRWPVKYGLHWVPNNRHSNLKQVEEALNTMIATGGEACPLPLTIDVQAELFPEVMHTRTGRRLHRSGIKTTRQLRRQSREYEQRWKLRQNLLEQAKVDLNFQSPETVCTVYPVERRV